MADVTYKCPSCGAYLAFSPESQKWKCDFCGAEFDEADVLPKSEEYAENAEEEHKADSAGEAAQDGGAASGGNEVVYHCTSCGSEIMTDETTVATQCYYCHNPVVLHGKLTADMKPDFVLPFTVSKEAAVEKFMSFVAKKKYVPKDFFSKQGVEAMSGVYYPHFITECEMDAMFQGEGQNVSVVNTSSHVITKTDHYSFRRRAKIHFQNVMRPALKEVNRKLSDGIHPFPLDTVKPFAGAYLSGFLAERRNIQSADIAEDVQSELSDYVRPMLSQSLSYSSYNGQASAKVLQKDVKYTLLPTWVLTYTKRKDKDGNPYYYVMNGSTGTVCGKLPIDKGKLRRTGAIVGAIAFAVSCVICYFL